MGDRSSARPLYSERADDPALSEALDAFALALADRIDQLQEAERAGGLGDVAKLAGSLADEATELGHQRLSRGARNVERAAARADSRETYAALVELTDLARRVRLGHRGAF
jgi:hypothetical protein